MRIAILTLPLHTNYGGILQCYALQTVLQRMGHEVKVLSKPRYGIKHYLTLPLLYVKNKYKKYILGDNVYLFETEGDVMRRRIDVFIKTRINRYIKRNWTERIADEFDAIIVGSDQVWRPSYSKFVELYYFSFLKNRNDIKRISYAASFGVDICEYNKEQLEKCSLLLDKFDAISVREFSGLDICRTYLGKESKHVLDPTLLLKSDDYLSLIGHKDFTPKKILLVYLLDKSVEKKNIANRIALDLGLTILWLNSPDEDSADLPFNKIEKISVEQWLYSFATASFVFTDSFHGCVFSIIFRKQFAVFSNEGRGLTRFSSLLSQLLLSDRMFCSLKDFEDKKDILLNMIDYDSVYDVLSLRRTESLDFLVKALEK